MAAILRSLAPLVLLPWLLAAQGVTTATVHGLVRDPDGTPVDGAVVRITHVASGRRWEAVTSPSGTYLLGNVAVGGPYRLEALAPGFAPEVRTGMALGLGARVVADFTLRQAAFELAPLTVTARETRALDAGRVGPSEILSRAQIAELPNLGRDFLTLTLQSPLVAISPSSGSSGIGGITIAGQNRLYNSFQIDGGVNHDLYRGILPGRETLPRPISLEALEQIQVLAAPFDVRYGTFAGGLVNAVTRSGTNAIHGSLFGSLADAALTGENVTDRPVADFQTWQFGATIGGPVVRSRVHYFVSVDVRDEGVPDPGPLIADTAGGADTAQIGITYEDALRFQEILRDTFGLDPGTLGPVDGRVRAADVFAKVTVQFATNSHLELSHHYAHGDRRGFISRTPTFYFLSSADRRDPSTSHASRIIWTSLLSQRWSNQLLASWLRLDDTCRPSASYGNVRVTTGPPVGTLVAGAPGGCPTEPMNSVVQDVVEITENLTAGFGAHTVTLGAHAEALQFRDDGLQRASGQWNFRNLDSLQLGRTNRYQSTLPGPGRTGPLEVRAYQVGVYAQDSWAASRGLTVTLGLRVDVPILPDAVATNERLRDSLGIDTGQLPTGNPLWSPRLAVHYDVGGRGRTFLRGGVGVFSGRPPYQWVGSAYRDNGAQELLLDCRGPRQAPVFDPENQPSLPTLCADNKGPVSLLSYFEPGTKFPQSLKVALGADHVLPGGVIGTLDVLYTRAVHQLYLTDVNLRTPTSAAHGEGDRPLYGTHTAAGVASPLRHDTTFGQVVRVANARGDDAVSISLQLRKQFGDRVTANGFYGFTRARDRMSVVNPTAQRNLENTPLDGTLDDRARRTSYFEIPHRVQLGATVRLPWRSWLSLLYSGASGTPYTHMVEGDANADGIGGVPLFNDPIYVPRDRADIAIDGNGDTTGVGTPAQQDSVYGLIDALIAAESCLREQRGQVLRRNSCRNPWFGTVNLRLAKAIPTRAGQSLELAVDVYNLLNLLNSQWGQYRRTIPDPWVQTLLLRSYDEATGRGVYDWVFRGLNSIEDLASRWQMELSVRYVF